MRTRWLVLTFTLLLLLFGSTHPAHADGIIVPPPCPQDKCPPVRRPIEQLEIRYHHVTVTIQDQLAVTHVDQVFYNPNDWPIQGTYVFPLPLDAAVSNFTLWVDGQPVKGEVLSAEQARQYYDETVRNLRDPALLEYAGRGAVKASVFPIAPQGERRIELEYSQALTAQNGLVRYVYPLNTEKFSAKALDDVSVRVEIRDRQAIRAVYSPSHPITVDRQDDRHVIAQYSARDVRPDSDFTLFYSAGETQAFHLFTYRDPADPADPDGFFLMLLAPQPGDNHDQVAKDVLLVLDHSGSMEGEKFQQAQAALRYILGKLNPQDRFYLQAFSSGIQTYADELRPASEADAAIGWVDRLNAEGSTDINRALLEASAVVDRSRPTYLIFLTDGLPTEGEINIQKIIDNVAEAAPSNLRLFTFGVGYDVNTLLLDSLAESHHGQSSYVRPGDSLDEALSGFYERISMPVLTDLKLDFGSLPTYDLYPNPLPDLFAGNQVVVVGRYRQGGVVDMTLRGAVNGETQVFRYPEQFFVQDSRGDSTSLDLIPRLWATRKIGYLLNHVRLQGADKETIAQIVNLSVRYGIVTPYTSYLVTEPMPLGAAAQDKIAEDAYGQAAAAPPQATGKGAVDRSAQEGQLQAANSAPLAPTTGAENGASGETLLRTVGPRTFILKDGVWVDTTYDPQMTPAQQVAFLSDAYFRLLTLRPDLSAVFALGDQVTVVVDGQAYQVVQEGQTTQPVKLPTPLPPTLTPAPPDSTPEATILSPQATLSPGETATAAPGAVKPLGRSTLCLGLLIPAGVGLAVAFLLHRRK